MLRGKAVFPKTEPGNVRSAYMQAYDQNNTVNQLPHIKMPIFPCGLWMEEVEELYFQLRETFPKIFPDEHSYTVMLVTNSGHPFQQAKS